MKGTKAKNYEHELYVCFGKGHQTILSNQTQVVCV